MAHAFFEMGALIYRHNFKTPLCDDSLIQAFSWLKCSAKNGVQKNMGEARRTSHLLSFFQVAAIFSAYLAEKKERKIST